LDKTEAIADDLKRYVSTRIALIKLETVDKSSEIGASVISLLIISIAAIFALIFLSIWAALYLSTVIDLPFIGFAVVGGFYTLVFLILLIGRKSLLEKPIRNKIVAGATREEVGENEVDTHKAEPQKQNTGT
ncbi:MAG: phage holin family protein, partial [Cryomorphaceae bacterium]